MPENNTTQERNAGDDAIAIMMFGKNASLIAKTAPLLFRKFGIHFDVQEENKDE
ncbi:MAG: hypothetical protein ACTSW4_05760 [Candidatus Ranarchaeia archaeon]